MWSNHRLRSASDCLHVCWPLTFSGCELHKACHLRRSPPPPSPQSLHSWTADHTSSSGRAFSTWHHQRRTDRTVIRGPQASHDALRQSDRWSRRHLVWTTVFGYLSLSELWSYVHNRNATYVQECPKRVLLNMLSAYGVHNGLAGRGFFFLFCLREHVQHLQLEESWLGYVKAVQILWILLQAFSLIALFRYMVTCSFVHGAWQQW